MLGVIVGGRLGYVLFYKPLDYINNPLQIFYVWEGGMSFHGGLIGVLIAVALARQYERQTAERSRVKAAVTSAQQALDLAARASVSAPVKAIHEATCRSNGTH